MWQLCFHYCGHVHTVDELNMINAIRHLDVLYIQALCTYSWANMTDCSCPSCRLHGTVFDNLFLKIINQLKFTSQVYELNITAAPNWIALSYSGTNSQITEVCLICLLGYRPVKISHTRFCKKKKKNLLVWIRPSNLWLNRGWNEYVCS